MTVSKQIYPCTLLQPQKVKSQSKSSKDFISITKESNVYMAHCDMNASCNFSDVPIQMSWQFI